VGPEWVEKAPASARVRVCHVLPCICVIMPMCICIQVRERANVIVHVYYLRLSGGYYEEGGWHCGVHCGGASC
jgi:hypothetical protein